MFRVSKRLIGLIISITAFAGMIISATGIYGVWQIQEGIGMNLSETLGLLKTTFEISDQALVMASASLDTADANIAAVQTTLLNVAQTVNDSLPVVDSFVTLTATDLPGTIEATQTSLTSAQASARLIDTMLGALTSIPFFPGEPYDPDVPLAEALGEVASNLEALPGQLTEMSTALAANRENLTQLETDLIALSTTVGGIEANIADAKKIVLQYQVVIEDLIARIELMQNGLPTTLEYFAWSVTALLAWLGITQLGLLTQGLELIAENKRVKSAPPVALPSQMA